MEPIESLANGKNRIAFMAAVLEHLSTYPHWVSSPRLLKALGVRVEWHNVARSILKRLNKEGKLHRRGQGKYEWKLVKEGESVEVAPDATRTRLPRLPGEPGSDRLGPLKAHIDRLERLLDEASRQVKVLEVRQYEQPVVKLKNVTPPKFFDDLIALAACRRNVMLVGPAGCGKTTAAKLAADALKMRFGTVSCTAGMNEGHLLGRSMPNVTKGDANFIGTEFLDYFENGGLFLLDEVDASDSNLLLALNTALDNGYANIPNRNKKPRADRHKDFVLIASANTFGRGATRQYAGRNQLDEATLDRFRMGVIECDYDRAIEVKVCPDQDIRTWCQSVRDRIVQAGLRRVMSTRFIRDAYIMSTAPKQPWTLPKIAEVFFSGWTADEKARAWVEPLPAVIVKLDEEVTGELETIRSLLGPANSEPLMPAEIIAARIISDLPVSSIDPNVPMFVGATKEALLYVLSSKPEAAQRLREVKHPARDDKTYGDYAKFILGLEGTQKFPVSSKKQHEICVNVWRVMLGKEMIKNEVEL